MDGCLDSGAFHQVLKNVIGAVAIVVEARLQVVRKKDGAKDEKEDEEFQNHDLPESPSEIHGSDRITSYNVCYTKLLRKRLDVKAKKGQIKALRGKVTE